MPPTSLLTEYPSYPDLVAHAKRLSGTSISSLFAADSARADGLIVSAAGLTLDYSKSILDRAARASLLELATNAEWQQHVKDLINGRIVNPTEERPALHTLLRASSVNSLRQKFSLVTETRARMRGLASQYNEGLRTGFSGDVITDIVNIGIGGSDLGPRLATEALTPFHGNVACHYVANVDPADLQDTLLNLDPGSTAFIVCSKSFRTQETLTNAEAARQWMLNAGASESDLSQHFLAITTNLQAAASFGISPDNCLPIWDWVGGRYSVWSAVGLSTAIAIGWDNFEKFLLGAEAMDRHLQDAPADVNMPLIMSLLEIWNCSFLDAGNYAVLPYCQHLKRLPEFLQQLTMESNGKSVAVDGQQLNYQTGPVLWGAAGTMGQHSFHQLLHQGTRACPVDFILPLTTHTGMQEQHRQLVANCLAQSRALMVGRSHEEAVNSLIARGLSEKQVAKLAPHLTMAGNRPNSLITMQAITPASLGALLALYEHRTYLSGCLWGINPFDQWGVELGKEIGTDIMVRMSADTITNTSPLDSSTERLMRSWKSAQAAED